MAESVIVHQNRKFETWIEAEDHHDHDHHHHHHHEEEGPQPVQHILSLSPYGMLLAGLGTCTALVLHTYAQNHKLPLEEVELRLRYARHFDEDCENCEQTGRYDEHIEQEIVLIGENLTEQQRAKLHLISHHCPIDKMIQGGVEVVSRLVEA